MKKLLRRRANLLLVLSATVFLISLTGGALSINLASGASPQVTKISIPNGSGINESSPGFVPSQVTVVIGVNNTIVWTDNDNMEDAMGYTPNHTVTADDKSFASDGLSVGDSFTYTFTTPGTFSYHCSNHAWMRGLVTVIGTAATTSSSATTSTTTIRTTTTPEFPLPFAVLLLALGAMAAAFAVTRRSSGQPIGPKP